MAIFRPFLCSASTSSAAGEFKTSTAQTTEPIQTLTASPKQPTDDQVDQSAPVEVADSSHETVSSPVTVQVPIIQVTSEPGDVSEKEEDSYSTATDSSVETSKPMTTSPTETAKSTAADADQQSPKPGDGSEQTKTVDRAAELSKDTQVSEEQKRLFCKLRV